MGGMKRRFCREESLQIDEPLAGTGTHAVQNLLISWPRAQWTRSSRRARDMSDQISELLDKLAAQGRRVNLIYRRDDLEAGHRIFLMPENQSYRVLPDQLPGFLEQLLAGTQSPGETLTQPILLCCTHGRKDRCCAKFGFQAYKALRESVRQEALPVSVWESSHLGGCRLAASAVVMPAMRKYGRISPQDALPLLQSEMNGRPYLPCLRGDAELNPVQQVARIAALNTLVATAPDAEVAILSEEPVDNGASLVVGWSAGEIAGFLRVKCREEQLIRFDTCADLDAEDARPAKVWRAVDVGSCEAPDQSS